MMRRYCRSKQRAFLDFLFNLIRMLDLNVSGIKPQCDLSSDVTTDNNLNNKGAYNLGSLHFTTCLSQVV